MARRSMVKMFGDDDAEPSHGEWKFALLFAVMVALIVSMGWWAGRQGDQRTLHQRCASEFLSTFQSPAAHDILEMLSDKILKKHGTRTIAAKIKRIRPEVARFEIDGDMSDYDSMTLIKGRDSLGGQLDLLASHSDEEEKACKQRIASGAWAPQGTRPSEWMFCGWRVEAMAIDGVDIF